MPRLEQRGKFEFHYLKLIEYVADPKEQFYGLALYINSYKPLDLNAFF